MSRRFWSGWRASLRIAYREARRARGRSVLVIALIGLPVLALSFAAVSFDSFRLTPEQELARELGAADAELHWRAAGPIWQTPDGRAYQADPEVPERAAPATAAELRAVLPAGSRVVPVWSGELELRTAAGQGNLAAQSADLTDPVHRGRLALQEGRAPASAGEVAVTPRAADRLGAGIGDTVTTADGSVSWTVTGLVEIRQRFQEAVVLPPAAAPGHPQRWLVQTAEPVSWQQVQELNHHGIQVRSRAVALDPPPVAEQYEFWRYESRSGTEQGEALAAGAVIAALATLEVVLLAGPAFAISARRRQRTLALVAVTGATPAQLRRVVLADGVVLGAAGALAGVGLGVTAGFASIPLLEQHLLNRPAGGLRWWPPVLAAIAGLPVFTGLLAALVPAVAAARQPVVTALAGRRGVTGSRRRWVVLALVLAALGTAVAGLGAWHLSTGLLVAGVVTSQLGLVLATPALVGLVARVGRFLAVSPRIALRDTARNRASAAPAISAVMAAVAGATAIGLFFASEAAREQNRHEPSLPAGYAWASYHSWAGDEPEVLPADQRPAVQDAIRQELPATEVIEVPAPGCPPESGEPDPATPGPDDPRGCGMFLPIPPENRCPFRASDQQLTDAQLRQARADERCQHTPTISGHAYSVAVDDGTLLPVLTGATGDDVAAATAMLRRGGVVVAEPRLVVDGHATVEVTGPDQSADPHSLRVPAHVLTTSEVTGWGRVFVSPQLVAEAGLAAVPEGAVAVTTEEPSDAHEDALRAALAPLLDQAVVYVERDARSTATELLVLAVAAAVIALGAAAIATGLATADRRGDLATLAAVGASPRVRRLLSLSQSGVIAGLGAALGVLSGLVTGLLVIAAYNQAARASWPFDEPYPVAVPWPVLAVTLLAVPAVAMLGAGLLTRSRLPVERRVA